RRPRLILPVTGHHPLPIGVFMERGQLLRAGRLLSVLRPCGRGRLNGSINGGRVRDSALDLIHGSLANPPRIRVSETNERAGSSRPGPSRASLVAPHSEVWELSAAS